MNYFVNPRGRVVAKMFEPRLFWQTYILFYSIGTQEYCKKMSIRGEASVNKNIITNVDFNDDFLILPVPKIL